MPPPSALAFSSSQAPLLQILHQRLTEYEDAVDLAYSVAAKYGHRADRYKLDPPGQEMEARVKRTSAAFDAVLAHVDVVDSLVEDDYVLLRRDRCAPGNVLYRGGDDDDRTVYTKSPILANARGLDLSFRPNPSREVLLRSPILSNSLELRLLAMPHLVDADLDED